MTTAPSCPTLILIEANWSGHHAEWFNHFVSAALILGWNVLTICPRPEEVTIPINMEHRVIAWRYVSGRCGVSRLPGKTSNIVYWWNVSRNIKRSIIEARQRGWGNFRIFYTSMYDELFRWFPLGERFLKIPWAGIYMNSHSFYLEGSRSKIDRPERLFKNRRALGVALLDETIVSKFQKRAPGLKVVACPDFSDPTFSSIAPKQVRRIKEFAGERKIVGLMGHLIPRKGIIELLHAAEQLESDPICFLLVGELPEYHYDDKTLTLLKQAENGKHSNVLGIYGRIDSNALYNSIMRQCDMIYAAYRDFPNSSNTLTKATQMRRPVIVSDGYVMAERTRRFGLGLCVPEGDVNAIAAAIKRIVANPGSYMANPEACDEFLRHHSLSRVPLLLSELMSFEES
jgi:glycosyltransferase involved in cell wall biosynthesis